MLAHGVLAPPWPWLADHIGVTLGCPGDSAARPPQVPVEQWGQRQQWAFPAVSCFKEIFPCLSTVQV